MTTAYAIRFQTVGGPEVLQRERIVLGDPGPNEVLVRHHAIGVNFIDTYHRSGLYPVRGLPSGLGMEAAGTIKAVGSDVRDFAVGDRVAYIAGAPGTYSAAGLVSTDRLIAIPDELSDETVAGVLLKGLTVEYLIRRTYPVQSGQTVLWHAAAGGVGLLACQWLDSLGVTVIGTVGNDEKAALARANGCRHTIVYTRENFRERVMEITDGQGVPVVFDSVGRDTFFDSLDCLRPRGMLVSFGNASGPAPEFAPGLLAQKGSLYLTRPTLQSYISTKAELAESSGALFDAMRQGAVRGYVAHRYTLADAALAHVALESRATRGSIVLIP